jgi:AcrR family transcriptional regulator
VGPSTTPRRHTDQGRERKQQLLDHATKLFATRGYANTRVIDICRDAGVAKGLFYWYFENKEALFTELVRSMRDQLQEARAAEVDPGADPLTQLCQAVEASVRFIARHTEFFTVVRMERREPNVSALLREAADADVAGVARLIAACREAGLIRANEPSDFLAQGVAGSVTTFCHAHRTGRLGLDVDELAERVSAWVVRAIGGRSPAWESDHTVASLRGRRSGDRQLERVAQTSQPAAPTGISAR